MNVGDAGPLDSGVGGVDVREMGAVELDAREGEGSGVEGSVHRCQWKFCPPRRMHAPATGDTWTTHRLFERSGEYIIGTGQDATEQDSFDRICALQ